MLKEMKDEDFIVSKTDLKGRIVYSNQIFMDMAEYTEDELLGKPHSIIRHPDMPKAVFRHLWNVIPTKQEIFAFVINKTKNNNDYWVYANVTATVDINGKIVDYYSVRRKPNPKALAVIIPLYKKMMEVEKSSGIDASFKVLTDILAEKGVSYDELVISLQNQ
ncbi:MULTISPECIES: PAS domain-containing protein [unclassified Sulfurimonas]|jgi:PAS domain S-box-containing protein|uniref:PAS domain-containing protein n=1 Tax=unclassified Sulfurimonas TaxID=2623549 RepID=UPI0008CFC4CF|nr:MULTISPECIES: PAS domain-containing protein [unclassified Sulfurimonas]OHE12321.1 MAG: PAS sensor protein [Sulfurimonas sp. RIFOXYC2_FULL_36_7]MBS4068815.1 PAS domain-containing protein [Sulfurimonas sp.]MDD3854455.1 PAS domain-containing protein [Sulfurimonas sp.]MDX9757154.1 PAS domain-containing protein [Sulfurimonas sp.]OHE04655.1 MAG: PAS sensor protein [Sulfurimonas sp. RIFOXYB12_FULL_35_9]